ncbi:TonB family protein [Brevundimonas sp. GCM10030266]|uniref:TonB family protein n=1 Tax=Brevundimonas sp. GCM10030266 TaxID=3273386 RepID=UPI00360AD12B
MLIVEHRPVRVEPSRRLLAIMVVLLLHLALIVWMAMTRGLVEPQPPLTVPTIEIRLFPPGGGGAPASADAGTEASTGSVAPASARIPEVVEPWDNQPPARTDASPSELLVGLGAVEPGPATTVVSAATEEAGSGSASGGSGTGVGGGSGSGIGAGVGSGRGGERATGGSFVGPQLLRRPTQIDIDRSYPAMARVRRLNGQAVISCVIGSDTKLRSCRVLRETPERHGFGEAAVTLANEYRYQPPMRDGRPVEGHVITFSVDYRRHVG